MRFSKTLGIRWIVLLTLALTAGCGADGGVGGTGISTLTGNVTLAASTAARASVDVEGIAVGIRGTNLRTVTDRTGEFDLEGLFDGDVTVEFTELDGTINQLSVDVPSAGTVSLQNVRFERGAATAERVDVDFEAIVVQDADCQEAGSTVLVSDRNRRRTYDVLLDDPSYESDSVRCDIEAPQCSDLLSRRILRIFGTQTNGPIHASRVRLISCRFPGSGGP